MAQEEPVVADKEKVSVRLLFVVCCVRLSFDCLFACFCLFACCLGLFVVVCGCLWLFVVVCGRLWLFCFIMLFSCYPI